MTDKPPISVDTVLLDTDDLNITDLQQKMDQWAAAALIQGLADINYEINFQFMTEEEIQQLNAQFRQKDKPTNVLSFPANDPFDPAEPFVGDIAICVDILKQEAETEQKSLTDHLAHLVIHSVLHCQGYDHLDDQEAEQMETLEIQILDQFGIANPY